MNDFDEQQKQEKHLKEQDDVLANTKKNMLVSASAGSGKTYIMIKYICQLVVDKHVPISDFLVLTFTKSAANQMKEKLLARLKEQAAECQQDTYIFEQIDSLSTANICTIDSFCERALKKYASVLGLNESFDVIDESQAKNLKKMAFDFSYKRFLEEFPSDFMLLSSTYKNDEEAVRGIVNVLSNIANSVADRDAFLQEIGKNFQEKFEKASDFVFQNFVNIVSKKIQEIEEFHVEKFEAQIKKVLLPILSAQNLTQLFSLVVQMGKMPSKPAKNFVGEEVAEKIGEIKSDISEQIKLIKSLKLDDHLGVQSQKNGLLERAMLKLFELYEIEYANLKNAQNGMDFSDLEKFMKILSQNENLFNGFKYVFVDEYQDTNKLQESIIKNIAKNCNFVAVGDLKQGIYGFRLASSEIFLKDLKEFSEDENSAVNYLKSNFRSNQKVLDFVNNIFKVCMTEKVAKVDYLSTSMLKAENDFVDEDAKAVNIDLIERHVSEPDEIPPLYSVQKATLTTSNAHDTMLMDIKRRINEVLCSHISDEGVLRQATFGDIAILARSRDGFFYQLETFLQENGIPVISNSSTKLASEPEIQMLINYLRVALCMDDEIALMSVLMSGLYLLDVQKIFDEKFSSGKSLLALVTENESGYYSNFLKDLDSFRLDAKLYGTKKAFLELFAKTNYFSYLNLRKGGESLRMLVDRFLSEVEKQDFDIPALVHYFDSVEISVSPEASAFGDCVRLTTIHDSKGLEYPIVFLIGCDKSISKEHGSQVQISENFGFALNVFDVENNQSVPSIRLSAIKQEQLMKNFAEELMIFYVALTRAKNRLYLFGYNSNKFFVKHDVRKCDSYFDFIFLALKKEKEKFLSTGAYEGKDLSISLVEDVEEMKSENVQNMEEAEIDEKIVKQIEDYIDFSYDVSENENFRLKESVSSLNKKNQDSLEKFSNENFQFGKSSIEIGNAYHMALKLLDFEKISSKEDLRTELKKLSGQVDLNLIDEEVLHKNVLILKQLTENSKVLKEKEFLLKEKISELLNSSVDDEILVQGVVDLFAIKKEGVILVDYKFSSALSDDYLIEKYKKQLKLYKIAIEKAFHLPVLKSYLLSLKNSKLISVEA